MFSSSRWTPLNCCASAVGADGRWHQKKNAMRMPASGDADRDRHQHALGPDVAGTAPSRGRSLWPASAPARLTPAGGARGSAAAVAGQPRLLVHLERRLEESFDLVVAAERVRHADEARDDRADRQDDERNRHRQRRLVRRTVVAVAAVRMRRARRRRDRALALSRAGGAQTLGPWNVRNTSRNM